jgi:hypothetical protein
MGFDDAMEVEEFVVVGDCISKTKNLNLILIR